MSNLRKSLLHTLFSGFNMRRWNDKLRPIELYEIDKQAHKMIVAFLLCHAVPSKNEEERDALLYDVIESALFDYFYRLVTTDLKPPLFYKIKENDEHYKKLTEYVEKELDTILAPFGAQFYEKFSKYHRGELCYSHPLTKHILKASHLFASRWEFNLIKKFNIDFDAEIPKIEKDFDELANIANFEGMEELKNILDPKNPLGALAHFCGQLRFQVRWSQEPRLPATTVLGHMFFVASVGYFASLDINACKTRIINNFFCGLFHDLPELLTRDIISPVKNSSEHLPDFIKQYEFDELKAKILEPLNKAGYQNITKALSYILGLEIDGEFNSCYIENDKIIPCDTKELHTKYNKDIYRPKDGELIKACDILAAFMEAQASMRHGVTSPQIVAAYVRMRQSIKNPLPEEINFKAILADFD